MGEGWDQLSGITAGDSGSLWTIDVIMSQLALYPGAVLIFGILWDPASGQALRELPYSTAFDWAWRNSFPETEVYHAVFQLRGVRTSSVATKLQTVGPRQRPGPS